MALVTGFKEYTCMPKDLILLHTTDNFLPCIISRINHLCNWLIKISRENVGKYYLASEHELWIPNHCFFPFYKQSNHFVNVKPASRGKSNFTFQKRQELSSFSIPAKSWKLVNDSNMRLFHIHQPLYAKKLNKTTNCRLV